MKCFHICTAQIQWGRHCQQKKSAVTMVIGQWTVPCDSLSYLYSHVQLCFSHYGFWNMVVILQYPVIAMQQNTLNFLLYFIPAMVESCKISAFYITQKICITVRWLTWWITNLLVGNVFTFCCTFCIDFNVYVSSQFNFL